MLKKLLGLTLPKFKDPEGREVDLSQLRTELEQEGVRGEFVILVAGAVPQEEGPSDDDYASLVRELMDKGTDKKQAIRTVAQRCGVSRRVVYQAVLASEGSSAP